MEIWGLTIGEVLAFVSIFLTICGLFLIPYYKVRKKKRKERKADERYFRTIPEEFKSIQEALEDIQKDLDGHKTDRVDEKLKGEINRNKIRALEKTLYAYIITDVYDSNKNNSDIPRDLLEKAHEVCDENDSMGWSTPQLKTHCDEIREESRKRTQRRR